MWRAHALRVGAATQIDSYPARTGASTCNSPRGAFSVGRFGLRRDRPQRRSWSGTTGNRIRGWHDDHHLQTCVFHWIMPIGYCRSDEPCGSHKDSSPKRSAQQTRPSFINGSPRSGHRHRCSGRGSNSWRGHRSPLDATRVSNNVRTRRGSSLRPCRDGSPSRWDISSSRSVAMRAPSSSRRSTSRQVSNPPRQDIITTRCRRACFRTAVSFLHGRALRPVARRCVGAAGDERARTVSEPKSASRSTVQFRSGDASGESSICSAI